MNIKTYLLKKVKVTYSGPGRYWLTNGSDSLPLGKCKSEKEVDEGVVEAVHAGIGDENWEGWEAKKIS